MHDMALHTRHGDTYAIRSYIRDMFYIHDTLLLWSVRTLSGVHPSPGPGPSPSPRPKQASHMLSICSARVSTTRQVKRYPYAYPYLYPSPNLTPNPIPNPIPNPNDPPARRLPQDDALGVGLSRRPAR